jgi:hypothetical protein
MVLWLETDMETVNQEVPVYVQKMDLLNLFLVHEVFCLRSHRVFDCVSAEQRLIGFLLEGFDLGSVWICQTRRGGMEPAGLVVHPIFSYYSQSRSL